MALQTDRVSPRPLFHDGTIKKKNSPPPTFVAIHCFLHIHKYHFFIAFSQFHWWAISRYCFEQLDGREFHSFSKLEKLSMKAKESCEFSWRMCRLQNSRLVGNVHAMNLLCACNLKRQSILRSAWFSTVLFNQGLKWITIPVSSVIPEIQIAIQMDILGSFWMFPETKVQHSFERMSTADPGKSSHLYCTRSRR